MHAYSASRPNRSFKPRTAAADSYADLLHLRIGNKDALRRVPFRGKNALVKATVRASHYARIVERNRLAGGGDDPTFRRDPDGALRKDRTVLAMTAPFRVPAVTLRIACEEE